MASDKKNENIVRLNHEQLSNLANRYSEHDTDSTSHVSAKAVGRKQDGNSRRSKRPDRELYQAGPRIQSRKNSVVEQNPKTGNDPPEPMSCRSSSVEKSFQDNNAKSNMPATEKLSARMRQKRPDLQVYVPRKHQVALVGDEDRLQTPEVVSPERTDSVRTADLRKDENSAVRMPSDASSRHQDASVNASAESKRYSQRRRRKDMPECVLTHRGGDKLHVLRLENVSDNNTDSSLEWDYETDIHLAKLKYRDDELEASGVPLKDLEFDEDEMESDVTKPGKRRRRRRRKPVVQEDGEVAATPSQSWADIMEMEERNNVVPVNRVGGSELNQNQSSNKTSGKVSASIESAIADAIFEGLIIKNSGKERVKNCSRDYVQGSGDGGEKGRQGGGKQRGERRRSRSQGNNNRRRNRNSVSETVAMTESGRMRRRGQETERKRSVERKDVPPPQTREGESDRMGGHVNKNKYDTTAVVRQRRNSENISRSMEANAIHERNPGKSRDAHNAPLKVVCSSKEAGRQVQVGPMSLPTKQRQTDAKPVEMNPVLGDRGVVNVRGVLPAPHIAEHLAASPQHSSHRMAPRGRGTAPSTRGGGHRTLFDPNNPTTPIQVSSPKLQFQDPFESQYSPDSSCFYDGYTPTGGPQQGPYSTTYPVQYSSTGSLPGSDGGAHTYPPQTYVDDSYNNEHFTHSYEPDMVVSQTWTGSAKADVILRDAVGLDRQLSGMLARRLHGEDGLQGALKIRRDLQQKYADVILHDPDLSNKHGAEQLLWKSAFYHFIEMFRHQLADGADDATLPMTTIREHLLSLLDEGTEFYEDLLQRLQTTYKFKLDDFLHAHRAPPENIGRVVKLALLSSQRTMICLGDIARYRELAMSTSNYGRARSWYMKAQQIAPKNGRPYNQLAILALYTRRKLDAVYYYMRSLAASNPFITARESLMSLFDDVRKKAEHIQKKRLAERLDRKQQQQRLRSSPSPTDHGGQRVEIWISSDGHSSCDPVCDNNNDNDDITKMSNTELNKRFVLSFLNGHGKLFSRIGMDIFPELSAGMLREFDVLLGHSPQPIGSTRLLQLMAINMFAIDNTAASKDSASMDDNCRPLVQEHAIQVGLEMFGKLAQQSTALLRRHLATGNCLVFNEDLHQVVPSIKMWCDWMTCHTDLWNPVPLPRSPDLGPSVDVWQSIADLCNVLKNVDINHVKLYRQKKEGCELVVLEEDVMLSGFVPLLSLPQTSVYVHCTVDKEIARDCLRVDKLRLFGDYLCGVEPPLLAYNIDTHRYMAVAPETDPTLEGNAEQTPQLESSKDEDDISLENSDGDADDLHSEEPNIRSLRLRKIELERHLAEHTRQQENIRAVLEADQASCVIELMIRPRVLVPDTNCFIDHLVGIRRLVDSSKYTVVVPLVVINELDGLKRASRMDHYATADHAQMVQTGANNAITYLEEQFEKRNCHLKALTSKGTVMDTISFRSEEKQDGGNNDDLILSCCLHYCQDKAREYMQKDRDEPIRLQREVVLLTDDRNLRLKAHTRNVPVKNAPAFLKWAKLG